MDSESKKHWTAEEDSHLNSLVKLFGTKKWAHISRELKTRYGISTKTGKQCRERWNNILNPKLIDEPWTAQEEKILFEKQEEFGNKWSQISVFLKGRSDNSIKNHFYSIVRKNLRRYNKKKPECLKLKGDILDLLEKEDSRKILMKKPRHYYKRTKKKQKIEKTEKISVEIQPKTRPFSKRNNKPKKSLSVSLDDEQKSIVCPTPVPIYVDDLPNSPGFKGLGSVSTKNSGNFNEGFQFNGFNGFDMTPNCVSGKVFFRDYHRNLSLKSVEEDFFGRNESRKSTGKEDFVRDGSRKGTETLSRGDSRKNTEKELERSDSRKGTFSDNLKFPCFTPTNKFQYYPTPKNGKTKFEYN